MVGRSTSNKQQLYKQHTKIYQKQHIKNIPNISKQIYQNTQKVDQQ